MPYDPAKPANNSLISAAELRSQLTSLNTDIQTRATQAALASEIAGTSSNTNGIQTLDFDISDPPTQGEVQTIKDKINEIINGLRRQ